MNWSDLFTFENLKLAVTLSGWVLAVLVFALSFIAPRTKTTADDKALEMLKSVRNYAYLAFSKIKYWHESGKLPANVNRYDSYLKEIEKAFEASWGQKIPDSLLPEIKLIADGMHAANKVNPQPGPVSK